jgi:excisionase family DNA binding protein
VAIREQVVRGMLTITQTSEALGIKESTVRAWLMRRKIGCVRLSPRCVRVPLEEVERMINEHTIPAHEPRP